jgi:hypothetical protein
MADNKKLFYPKIEPGDIQQIHPDGGGVVMTKDFKALVGDTNSEVVDNLNREGYNGYIDAIPNNMNGIFVYSEQAPSLENAIPVGNENRTSIIEPAPVAVVAPTSPPVKGVIIGDSQVPLIYKNTRTSDPIFNYGNLLQPISQEGVLWKSGWGTKALASALKNLTEIQTDITHVFICIGTNDGFNTAITQSMTEVAENIIIHYPNAQHYLIKGSYGWGGVKDKTAVDAAKYAQAFSNVYSPLVLQGSTKFLKILTNEIGPWSALAGISRHPEYYDEGIVSVSGEIDGILRRANEAPVKATVVTPAEQTTAQDNPTTADQPVYQLVDTQVMSEAAKDNKSTVVVNTITPPPSSPTTQTAVQTAAPTASLPAKQPVVQTTTTQTTNQTPTQTTDEEESEGIYNVDFSSLPNRESDVIPGINTNTNAVTSPTSLNTDDLLGTSGITVVDLTNEKRYTTGATKTDNLGAGVPSTGGNGNVNLNGTANVLQYTGKITDADILNAVISAKTGATNVIDFLISCNPENGPAIYNSSLPKFKRAGLCTNPPKDNPILVAIGNKMGPYNGIYGAPSLWCASGASFAFLAFNQTADELKTTSSKSGGFPASTSSYIVPTKQFTGAKVAFVVGVDFNTQGQLTDSGIVKWNTIQSYKGAVFTVGNSASGHIGFILHTENPSKGGFIMHCLECNVGKGSMKFLKRYIGMDWSRHNGGNQTNIYIGDTSTFTGGAYATNGIGSDYSLKGIGSVKAFYTNNPSL